MGIFLNSAAPFEKYKSVVFDEYFVDKTALLGELMPALGRSQRFLCITRPRRFGKTVMANMIAAFFGKAREAQELFDGLKIVEHERYKKYLNQYNVIFIDFSEVPRDCDDYKKYIARVEEGLYQDLSQAYPEVKLERTMAVWDMLSLIFEKRGEKFIFVIDEWDAIFHMSFKDTEDEKRFLLFLKALLKDKSYVELAYMTGVLPIAKYSSGSELNNFLEYSMVKKARFAEYFGFTETEVDKLYETYRTIHSNARISRDQLREWYDGYDTMEGIRVYNPRSVVCALIDNQLSNYWTSSGPYDEIFYYIRNDIEHIRDDLAVMIAGEGIEIRIEEFSAAFMELNTREQIYSAMVVYGLLTYKDGQVFIPNKELMRKYEELLHREVSLGYVYQLAQKSNQMLKATLAGDTETMKEILQYAHNTETPVLSYNNETELAALVNLVYLSARDKYKVEREDKAGKGYADFIFYPINPQNDCLILELKVDYTPEEAILQIKEKGYALRFLGKMGEAPLYTGRILAVGISYDRKMKEHACAVEEL